MIFCVLLLVIVILLLPPWSRETVLYHDVFVCICHEVRDGYL